MKRLCMALLTGVRECVARETGTFVQHCQLCVTTRFELRERQMARRRLIMAPAAVIRNMANGAVFAIKRSIFPVNVVLPSRRMRNGHHYLVAPHALLLAYC